MSFYMFGACARQRWQVLAVSFLAALLRQGVAEENKTAPLLDSFCGLMLGGERVSEPMVVDCSCCTTFMVGDYTAQVELLFGGHPVTSTVVEGGKKGQVPLWTLGEHVPEVTCSNSQPVCNCFATDTTWAEFEPSCRAGPTCRREQPPVEWAAVCATGVPCGARDRAAALESGGKAPVPNAADMVDCTAMPAGTAAERQDKKSTMNRRVSLGSARCEDASPEQCHLFYSKVGSGWKQCESTASSVKQCAAVAVTEASARAETARMEAWATKNSFTPGAWNVSIQSDGTIKAATTPSRKDLMKQIEHLPLRIHAGYKI